VANSLSRKTLVGGMASTYTTQKKLLLDMERVGIEMSMEEVESYLSNLTLEPTLLEQIRVAQIANAKLISIREVLVRVRNQILILLRMEL
jgi:hypothetical protein